MSDGVGDRLRLERYGPIRCHGLGSAFVGNTVGEFGRDDAGIDASHTELVIFLAQTVRDSAYRVFGRTVRPPARDAYANGITDLPAARYYHHLQHGGGESAQAAEKTREIAQALGPTGLKIAYVTGDDVLDQVKQRDLPVLETGARSSTLNAHLVSANAYLGAAPIVEALAGGADVVLTERVADPALFAAPLIHELGWSMTDWHKMGQATLVGHLLECAGQITGGYFADPGFKDVPDLGRLGFPLAEVDEQGTVVITKVPGSGGHVTLATCKEQLLYEIHDPACYLTPDVKADFSQVEMTALGSDRVQVRGGSGRSRPETLKVSMGYLEGYIGEGQISYGGPGAVARGRLALDIIRQRLALLGVIADDVSYDLIGHDALLNTACKAQPNEVRMRVALRTEDPDVAELVGREVEALYTNGPAGGGGASRSVRQVLAVASVLLPRGQVNPAVHYLSV